MTKESYMPAVRNVLVIGAGLAGTASAIRLAQSGVAVDIAEKQTDVSALGSGITLQGNALRALRELGVWEQAEKLGYSYDSLGLRAPDPNGTLIVELDEMRTGGPDLPATAGMYRPDLARLLMERAIEVGAKPRLGVAPVSLRQDEAGVDVEFDDGTSGRYDLVIGADGVRSTVRSMIGIETEPEPTGMGIFRVFTGRPESITRTDLCFDGPCYIAGFCPTGADSMYAYLVEPQQDRSDMLPEDRLAHMRRLAEAYHGPWDDIRELMTDPSTVHYTLFEKMLLERPWWRGRVALIGDAAHTCPPTVAQGAAQAMEDALVMAESLLAHDDVDTALDAFMERRFERAKTVVEASVQIGQWMIDDDPDANIPGLMMQTLGALCAPA